jgi:hypothetical protein
VHFSGSEPPAADTLSLKQHSDKLKPLFAPFSACLEGAARSRLRASTGG